LLHECTLPLTGTRVVDMVISNLGVFEIERGVGMKLIELAPGVSVDEVKAKTEADFEIAL
jgi:3-oxoacid CoA-transferase subunit B/3-oxoadipate CoA-transferase beta subunit